MPQSARRRTSVQYWILALPLVFLSITPVFSQGDWSTLFSDEFEVGVERRWELGGGWMVDSEMDNHFLHGAEHYFAVPRVNGWSDYSVEFQFRLYEGSFHANFRETVTGEHRRYFVSVSATVLQLQRQQGATFDNLRSEGVAIATGTWHTLKMSADSQAIVIALNGTPVIEFTDTEQPLFFGRFSFECLESSVVQIDEVLVMGEMPADSPASWIRTGGPSGGLGYDVRIHPTDKNLMFVTDNPSGINKSYDGGKNWTQKNTGITTTSGASNDGIPVFSLTVDPSEPNIVWAGTQYARGIYKSVDGGDTWLKKDSGIAEGADISFRGFGVHPTNPDIVFAGAEITTGILGKEFDRTQGKIYRTADGGGVWTAVWEGGNLVRFVLFDPQNPEVLYASTGIFDREAIDSAGVGLLKSTNGGFDWIPINNGIPDTAGYRFFGFLEMHPEDPQILYAASGNNAAGKGGVFKTVDGGDNWVEILSGDIFTIVTISPSHPDVIYVGSFNAFYRSEDGGDSWDTLQKVDGGYGPPGIKAGFPISAVVDPEDPYMVFANNYMGGNFKSSDGAETWENSSNGYTGAELHAIAIDPANPALVYTIGRSGPFRSYNGGNDWEGMRYAPATSAEWYAVTMNPDNADELLISGEFDGNMFKSVDGGQNWSHVFDHPSVDASCPTGPQECRHGFKAIAYAPSNPSVVYAGMCKGRRSIDGDFPARASYGMFRSTNGGDNWSQINTGLPTSLLNINCIAVQPNNDAVAYVGTWKDGVYKTTDGGLNWFAANNGLTSSDVRSLAIDPTDTTIIYAGTGDGAGMFKSTDGGALWTTINSGLTLKCPQYLGPIGRVAPGMSLEQPPAYITGPDYYRAPWTSIKSIVIDPTDPQRIYAADYNSGVYTSPDGGTSWSEINDSLTMRTVVAMAVSDDGGLLYAATFGGGVFRLPLGTNHAPRIAYTTPPTDSILTLGQNESIELCLSAYDLDGDDLSYSWMLDGLDWPGSDYCLILNGVDLTPGYHLIEVEVSDADTSLIILWEIDLLLDVNDGDTPEGIPREYSLSQNHPNPFNPSTVIDYALPYGGEVTLDICNILGQVVVTLIDGSQPAGHHSAVWDGRDSRGKTVASGVYLYRLNAGSFRASRKMLLLK